MTKIAVYTIRYWDNTAISHFNLSVLLATANAYNHKNGIAHILNLPKFRSYIYNGNIPICYASIEKEDLRIFLGLATLRNVDYRDLFYKKIEAVSDHNT